jgi:diguanylate cyclase (GGDEF)-like protein/PAS domain S-box-containing protein
MKSYTRMTKAELIKALRARDTERPSQRASKELHHVVRNLQLQQLEAELQNRELRGAQHQLEESRDRYADLYDFAPLGYVTLTRRGVIREINLPAAAMLGADRHRHIGVPFVVYVDRNDTQKFITYLRNCRVTRKPAVTELRLARLGAAPLPVQLYALPMPERMLHAFDCRIAIADISQRVQAEAGLRLAATVFSHCGEAIVVCDEQFNVLSVNRAFREITGYTSQEVVGRSAKSIDIGLGENDQPTMSWRAAADTGYWQGESWGRHKNGTLYPEWATITCVRNEHGAISHYIVIFSDITQRKAASARIEHLAHYDALTNLPNRTLLHDRLAHALTMAQRNRSGVAVLFLDIDLFKTVNDSLGHVVGDQLLRTIATRLTQCLRTGDTVSRRGGDEFIGVLLDIDDVGELSQIVEKLLNAIRRPVAIDGIELNVTASIGVSLYPQDGQDIETLIKHADIAMYHAKERGRNNYQFFKRDLNADVSQRLALENGLHRALEREEFELHYQPQMDTATGEIRGCEALIRWQHPERGLLLPDRFIPLAEKCGLINAIGEWVLRAACAQHHRWQADGLGAVRTAVNLSGIQLRQKNFPDKVAEILRERAMDPYSLAIELTESTLLQDVQTTVCCLQQLKAMGLQIVLDDFGTGYSSLSYLKRFPIDKLKIDKSFVHDLPRGDDDITLVRTIINMGHNLHLAVIAEGVETRDQFEFLRSEQCEEMQGNFIGRPMTAAEFGDLLRGAERTRWHITASTQNA